MGLVLGGKYIWCLDKVVIFMGFEQAGAKRCGGHSKVVNWGSNASRKWGALFIRKGGSHYVILPHCKNFILSLACHCKIFYRIPFFIILLFFLFCIY